MNIKLSDYIFFQNDQTHHVVVFKEGRAVLSVSCNGPLDEHDFLELLHFIQKRGSR